LDSLPQKISGQKRAGYLFLNVQLEQMYWLVSLNNVNLQQVLKFILTLLMAAGILP